MSYGTAPTIYTGPLREAKNEADCTTAGGTWFYTYPGTKSAEGQCFPPAQIQADLPIDYLPPSPNGNDQKETGSKLLAGGGALLLGAMFLWLWMR